MPANLEAAMLEMFRAEVETHMAALNDGLLALERRPDQSERFEALMRAAHSIKGAAKIVGLPAAVRVAHAIEDCFVAARKGETRMTSGLVDVLLEGIDLLGRAAEVDASGHVELDEGDPRIADIAARIASAATSAPAQPQGKARGERATTAPGAALVAPAQLTGDWLAQHHDRLLRASLDLRQTTAIDAAALGYLSLVAQTAAALRIAQASPEIRRLLTVTGLGVVLETSAVEAHP